jgi:hypothetical protein
VTEAGQIFREAWMAGVTKHYPGSRSSAMSRRGTTLQGGRGSARRPVFAQVAESSRSARATPRSCPGSSAAGSWKYMQTDTEQILLNAVDAGVLPGVGRLASSRIPCPELRPNGRPAQNFRARLDTYPGIISLGWSW